MKNAYFYLVTICLLIVGAIIISCTKQNSVDLAENPSKPFQSAEDFKVEKEITSFINKLDFIKMNPNLKNGETIAIDSAIYYLEAASNMTYANAGESIQKYVIDSCYINVTVTNGIIQLAEVQNAYEQMIDSLSYFNANLPSGYKQLVMNDVTLKAMDEDEGNATLGIVAGFNIVAEGSSSISFDPWYWGMLNGKCNGTYAGISDAAEELEKKIMLRKGIVSGNSYYTEIDSVEVLSVEFINPNDPIPGDNMYDFLMFRNLDDGFMPNVHICLSSEEMSFYLLGTEQVVYNYAPDGARPEGKSFISLNLVGDYVLTSESTEYFHYGKIFYGVLHINSKPPISL
jgi:hypothetical protein